jgi:aminopeptidase YwaD
MMSEQFTKKAEDYLHYLCGAITDRSVGSSGNVEATDFFARRMEAFGFHVESSRFSCIDWKDGGSSLASEERMFRVKTSPYTLGCDVTATLCMASTIRALSELDARGKIILLKGEIAREQLMPKSFPYYNPEEHQQIHRLLDNSGAKAIITATSRNPQLAGGMYPFPMIEDGDFDIPSVYMTDVDGDALEEHVGQTVHLRVNSQRIPSAGFNVVATKGLNPNKRIVISAHIDSKKGTPGAIDNATGVITLLLLAERMRGYRGELTLEFVAFNGEDYYAISGQNLYFANNVCRMNTIALNINIDGAGYRHNSTAISFYGCPPSVEEPIRAMLKDSAGIVEGAQWIQSDHGIFVMSGISAIAVTSNCFMETLAMEITHTPNDKPEIVDCSKLVEISELLERGIRQIASS